MLDHTNGLGQRATSRMSNGPLEQSRGSGAGLGPRPISRATDGSAHAFAP
eukprot:gene1739-6823_t